MCLHHEPARRPNMKQLNDWLHEKVNAPATDEGRFHQSSPAPRVVEVPPSKQGNEQEVFVPGIEWVEEGLVNPLMPVVGCKFQLTRSTSAGKDNKDKLTVRKLQEDPDVHPDEEEARWLFDQTDEDGNGKLDKDELRKLLEEAGISVTESTLAEEFNTMDAVTETLDGEVEFEAFKNWWITRKPLLSDDIVRTMTTRRKPAPLTLEPVPTEGWSDPLKFRCQVKPGWLIVDKHGHNWNTLGKLVAVVGTRNEDWQESALTGDEEWQEIEDSGDAAEPALFSTKLGLESEGKGLGVVFAEKVDGKKIDTWPRVKRIDAGAVKDATPELRVGCRLISINGESVDGMAFKEAAPLTKVRPLELVWQDLLVEWVVREEGDLGLVFGDRWPCIKKIKEHSLGSTAAVENLTAGCQLLMINGVDVEGMAFKDVGGLVKDRPLTLVFAQARSVPEEEEPDEEELLKARSAPDQLGLFTGPAEPEPEPQAVRARSHTTLMPRLDAALPEGMAPGTMRAPSPSSLLAKQNSKASSDGTEGGE